MSDPTLFQAAANGDLDLVRQLLASGADVRQFNNDGETALHLAAAAGHLLIVKELITHGAEVNSPKIVSGTSINYTPVAAAVSRGRVDVVKYLSEKGGTLYQVEGYLGYINELNGAAAGGSLEMVRYLVEDKKLPIDEPDSIGVTPLFMAIETLHAEILRYLIDKGANPHATHGSQPAPIDYAKMKLSSADAPARVTLELMIKTMAGCRAR